MKVKISYGQMLLYMIRHYSSRILHVHSSFGIKRCFIRFIFVHQWHEEMSRIQTAYVGYRLAVLDRTRALSRLQNLNMATNPESRVR